MTAGSPTGSDIDPLTPARALSLRFGIFSRFTPNILARHAETNPDLSFVVRDRSDFAVGGMWRRRHDVGEVVEVSRGRHRAPLLARLVSAFEEKGFSLVVLDYDEDGNDGSFYALSGFKVVETIVLFERRGCQLTDPVHAVPVRDFESFGEPADPLLSIDRESFPWIWWNSEAELLRYLVIPGVGVLVSHEGGETIGYAGFTIKGRAGHLDRLAVRERYQGRGHGASLLTAVLERMAREGVTRVTLSTQESNSRSRSLYERFGFRLGHWRYDIRGLWLRDPREV